MARKIRYLANHDHGLHTFQVIGLHSSEQINVFVRERVRLDPESVAYDTLWDLRRWQGAVTDTDIERTVKAARAKREQTLGANTPPLIVYLGERGMGLEFSADQLARARGGNVLVAHTPENAWAMMRPGLTIPPDLKSFLKA